MFEQNPADKIEQLEAMRLGVDYRLQIQVRDFKTMVRPLTIKETIDVASRVVDRVRTLPENARTALAENVFLAEETLMLASTSDVGKNDPSLTGYIMDRMTPDELQSLHRQYVAVCDKVNPVLEEMPAVEIESMVAAIKKKELHLTELSFLQAVNLVRYLTKGD